MSRIRLMLVFSLFLTSGCKNRGQTSIALASTTSDQSLFGAQLSFSGKMTFIGFRSGTNGAFTKSKSQQTPENFRLAISTLSDDKLIGVITFKGDSRAFWATRDSSGTTTIQGSAFKNLIDLYEGSTLKLEEGSTFKISGAQTVESENIVFRELGDDIPPSYHVYSVSGSVDR